MELALFLLVVWVVGCLVASFICRSLGVDNTYGIALMPILFWPAFVVISPLLLLMFVCQHILEHE